MSKLARKPIKTDSLDVTYDKNELKIKGKLGELTLTIKNNVSLKVEDNSIEVQCENKAILGLHCALIKNLVEGVTNGYSETLTLKGVGYRAALSGSTLNFNLGYSHPVSFDLPEGIKAEVVNPTEIKISGIDKQLVGQACARLLNYDLQKRILTKRRVLNVYKIELLKRLERRLSKMTKAIHTLKVNKTLKHLYAMLIDENNNIIAESSTLSLNYNQANVENSYKVGEEIGKKAKELKVKSIRFDRNGNIYHGRVESLAKGAREAGLEF